MAPSSKNIQDSGRKKRLRNSSQESKIRKRQKMTHQRRNGPVTRSQRVLIKWEASMTRRGDCRKQRKELMHGNSVCTDSSQVQRILTRSAARAQKSLKNSNLTYPKRDLLKESKKTNVLEETRMPFSGNTEFSNSHAVNHSTISVSQGSSESFFSQITKPANINENKGDRSLAQAVSLSNLTEVRGKEGDDNNDNLLATGTKNLSMNDGAMKPACLDVSASRHNRKYWSPDLFSGVISNEKVELAKRCTVWDDGEFPTEVYTPGIVVNFKKQTVLKREYKPQQIAETPSTSMSRDLFFGSPSSNLCKVQVQHAVPRTSDKSQSVPADEIQTTLPVDLAPEIQLPKFFPGSDVFGNDITDSCTSERMQISSPSNRPAVLPKQKIGSNFQEGTLACYEALTSQSNNNDNTCTNEIQSESRDEFQYPDDVLEQNRRASSDAVPEPQSESYDRKSDPKDLLPEIIACSNEVQPESQEAFQYPGDVLEQSRTTSGDAVTKRQRTAFDIKSEPEDLVPEILESYCSTCHPEKLSQVVSVKSENEKHAKKVGVNCIDSVDKNIFSTEMYPYSSRKINVKAKARLRNKPTCHRVTKLRKNTLPDNYKRTRILYRAYLEEGRVSSSQRRKIQARKVLHRAVTRSMTSFFRSIQTRKKGPIAKEILRSIPNLILTRSMVRHLSCEVRRKPINSHDDKRPCLNVNKTGLKRPCDDVSSSQESEIVVSETGNDTLSASSRSVTNVAVPRLFRRVHDGDYQAQLVEVSGEQSPKKRFPKRRSVLSPEENCIVLQPAAGSIPRQSEVTNISSGKTLSVCLLSVRKNKETTAKAYDNTQQQTVRRSERIKHLQNLGI